MCVSLSAVYNHTQNASCTAAGSRNSLVVDLSAAVGAQCWLLLQVRAAAQHTYMDAFQQYIASGSCPLWCVLIGVLFGVHASLLVCVM